MYIKRGSSFHPTNEANMDIRQRLPAGNYTIKMDMRTEELYFDEMDDFPIPSKIYGDTLAKAERIANTYQSRTQSTGALFTGEKGSGKTMLAKVLSNMFKEAFNIPTILVNAPWTGDKFNRLIQELPEALVLFDEYEKVYKDRDNQQMALTLLDGVFPSKKMFIFTCNDKHALDSHLNNRPGRIFYSIDYKGLDAEFITEYCNDRLDDKKGTSDILKASTLFEAFNFDMLQALVEEMNRYKESPYDALKMLNIRPSSSEGRYTAAVFVGTEQVAQSNLEETYVRGNPLTRDSFRLGYYHGKDASGDNIWHPQIWTRSMITNTDLEDGEYEYSNGEGVRLILTKQVIESADYYKWMAY